MNALLYFMKEFLGIGLLPDDQAFLAKITPKKKPAKVAKAVEFSLTDIMSSAIMPWWKCPLQKNESVEFEAIENCVLYEELEVILNESRLEVIELPATIAAVMKKIHQKQFWYGEVVDLIEMSPALSGDFLSLVNSAAFSRGQFIYNLDQALPRLGRKKIQSILFLNASKMSLPETPLFETVSKEIISQSQAVAKICRLMSPFFQVDSNEAFLAGLLHNIGKIGLLKQISKHYNLPEDLDVEYHQSLFNNILPAFESRAAQQICQYWKLEHKIVETIRLHESLDSMDRSAIIPENLKLIALVNLAVYLSRILGYGNSLKTTDVFGLVSAQILKFHDNEQSRQLLQKVHGSFQESLDTVKNIA